MAVAPPLNILVSKAPLAVAKIETALFKITNKISEKVIEASKNLQRIPKTVKCDDPRIVRLKQILAQIQQLLDQLQKVLNIINTVYGILVAVVSGAYAYIGFRLTVPTPSIPADIELLEAQKQLASNILDSLKKLGVVLAVINATVITSSALLAPIINKLSAVCNNEVFEVSQATQDAIEIDLTKFDIPDSKFYQEVNVSDSDIQSRYNTITTLLEQQRPLIDLLEAPSRVLMLSGNNTPNNAIGKSGDFAINTETKTIYGPKPSDSEWNAGINY